MQGQGDLKKNPAELEKLKKISSSLKILQPLHQKSNGPPLSSVGRAPDCRAGSLDTGFEPQTGPTLRVLK